MKDARWQQTDKDDKNDDVDDTRYSFDRQSIVILTQTRS